MSLLESVIDTLLEKKPLNKRYKNHSLTGNYAGFKEYHILPDWLFAYSIDHGKLILTASRTGTHADLFRKFHP